MGMKAKILIPGIIITLVVAVAILVSNIVLFSGFVDTSTVNQVNSTMNVVVHSLEAVKAEVEALSLNVAGDPAIIEAAAANKREELLARLMSMRDEIGFDFCTVTDAQGMVLARTHAPGQYGDFAAGQANIRAAMNGETMTAVEAGSIVRLSVRAGTPIYDEEGRLAGVVSLGYRLDTNRFVDLYKKMTGCEINILLGDERVATTVLQEDGTRAIGTKADPEIVKAVLGGHSYSGRADILGRPAVAKYIPIDGPEGRPIGMIFVGQYIEEETKTIMAFVRDAALITLLMLAVSIVLILVVVERIVRPIRAMTGAASALAVGDTDLEVRAYGHDETRALAEAFNSIIKNTRRQIETVEHIAAGDMTITLTPRSEKDAMNRALEKLNATIKAQAAEIREEHERLKKMVAEIEQRDTLLQAVNQAAETLLRSEPDNFAGDLRHCMGIMAGAAGADRMFVWRNYMENGSLRASQVHEWRGEERGFSGAAPFANISYDDTFPQFKAAYLRGECVNTLTRSTPPWAQADFKAGGILAIMAVPIFIRNEFWGVVTFDNCHSEEIFSPNAESVMRSGSILLTSAILRNEFMLELRDTSARLETALAEAKTANSAKSAFLAHMSHEIRTPLNAVVGLSGLALDDGGFLTDEMKNRLETIHGSGQTILYIINDILDISKIESGKFELFNSKYDTPSLLNDLITLNMVRIGEKAITFRLDADENLPGKLFGDELRVKQIFNNLLSNAFKYTNSGTVEWRVRHEREGDAVWLISSVRDTGIGIRPEELKKLFSDYNQANLETNRNIEGTGLGLAITKRLVEMMDGSITVESEYGKGTAFHVRLRQAIASETPIGREVAQNLMSLRYMLSKRNRNKKLTHVNLSYAHVLVVDDIPTNIDVVRGIMKPYGLKIDCATSGLEAIEMIRAENPRYSAIFMDHMMPGIDGIEAARRIREEIGTEYARTIPIIALTANAIVGNEKMFLSRGFQDFISKPIDTARLDSVLRRWVRDREREKEFFAEKREEAQEEAGRGLLDGLSIEGLDTAGALSRFNNDEGVFIDVLRSYVSGTKVLLDALKKNLNADNLGDYGITVHGIKGSSHGIFALEAGAQAEELEKAARAGDIEKVRAGHAAFEDTVKTLIEAIELALTEIDAKVGKPAVAAPDPALLRELREACEAFAMDRVDAIMAKLESFRYDHGSELIAWLRQKVNEMAFEEISNPPPALLETLPGTEGADFTAPEAKILIVDDNETNLKAALGLLRPLQMRMDTAESGEEALRMIRETRYDLIFMDHLMPVMDGIETTRKLREIPGKYYQQAPVIALAADEAFGAGEDFLRAGMNDVAAKPIDLKEISLKIRRWLPAGLLREEPRPVAAAFRDDHSADLPHIDGIDSQAGVHQSGSKEIFISLLRNFHALIDMKAARMESCMAEGRLRDLAIEAHALKNAARMIGAADLSENFSRLERYGNEGDRAALERELPEILKKYRVFKESLSPFAEGEGQEKKAASARELIALLQKLKSSVNNFDLDGTDGALRQLEQLRMPGEAEALMGTLKAYVADVAPEEIIKTAETMTGIIERLEDTI